MLDDIQPAILLHEHGIMINVPAPGRFALHKCIISQKRPAADAAKSRKDLLQAEQVFQVLLETRPGDIALAFDAAKARGEKFVSEFFVGLSLIGEATQKAVRQLIKSR